MSCYYRVMMNELVNHLKNVRTSCEVCMYVYICILFIYYIKLKSRLSVCLSVRLLAVMPVTQLCLHVSTWDLHYTIAMSSGMCKFVLKVSKHYSLLTRTLNRPSCQQFCHHFQSCEVLKSV